MPNAVVVSKLLSMEEPALSDLVGIFHAHEKHSGKPLIGIEHEKISYCLADGGPVPYEGKSGILRFLAEMSRRFSWEPYYVEGHLLALTRGRAQVTLEPGGQIELSGTPHYSLEAVASELQQHLREVVSVGDALGIGFSSLAFHPTRDPKSVEFVPKPRYRMMRKYFEKAGSRGLHMMANTATTQVNLDFFSQKDAAERISAAQLASPYLGALFANAPFENGELTDWQSRRLFTWLDVDRTRSGYLSFARADNAQLYTDYARWALASPMFGIHRMVAASKTFIPFNGRVTFLDYITHGYEGHRATNDDWADHLATMFPEVRLKKTIELRGQDSGGYEHAMAIAALWRGLLDDPDARGQVSELLPVPEQPREFHEAVARQGLRAKDADGRVIDRCFALVQLAAKGLRAQGESTVWLEPVFEALDDGLSPADWFRRALPAARLGSGLALLNATRYTDGL